METNELPSRTAIITAAARAFRWRGLTIPERVS